MTDDQFEVAFRDAVRFVETALGKDYTVEQKAGLMNMIKFKIPPLRLRKIAMSLVETWTFMGRLPLPAHWLTQHQTLPYSTVKTDDNKYVSCTRCYDTGIVNLYVMTRPYYVYCTCHSGSQKTTGIMAWTIEIFNKDKTSYELIDKTAWAIDKDTGEPLRVTEIGRNGHRMSPEEQQAMRDDTDRGLMKSNPVLARIIAQKMQELKESRDAETKAEEETEECPF